MGSMPRIWIIAVLLIASIGLSPPGAWAAEPLRGVALVIGQADYQSLPALTNTKNDAEAMAGLLGKLGFAVTPVIDARREDLLARIAEFEIAAKTADVALVYYSGHGIEAGGENYLVPLDGDLGTPQKAGATLVPVSALLDELAKSVPVTIVLLDACRSDAFPAGTMIQPPGATEPVAAQATGLGELRGPAPVGNKTVSPENLGMVIGFAASPGQPALDSAEGEANSPYAAALLKHLAAGGYSFGDLMTMVGEEVYLKTKARQMPWVNSSLRRVLNFGVVQDAPDADNALIAEGRRDLLLTISAAPEPTKRFVETVADSDGVPLDGLYGMLKVLGVDTSGDAGALEQQLRDGAAQLKALTEAKPGAVRTDTELVRLAGLADKAQAEGAIDVALIFREQATKRADELDASVDENEANLKADRLQIGATYADHAATAGLNFEFGAAAELWGKAYDQVQRWDEALALGYLWEEAGALRHLGTYRGDNDALTQSVAAYQEALKLAGEDSADWPSIMNDLGSAYEVLGERDETTKTLQQAVVAYQASLDRREAGSRDWGGTQGNLGVVLMNLGQREQGTETLTASAEAFDAAIGAIGRSIAPLDWARMQSNLGNVLQMLGDREGNPERYGQAAEAHRLALEELTRAVVPLDWATAENNLGNALARVGEATEDNAKIEDAVTAFRAALEERTRERVPVDWSSTMVNLGNALSSLGQRKGDADRLREGIASFEAAGEVQTREMSPIDWAYRQRNIGIASKKLGELTDDDAGYEAAIGYYQGALEVFTQAETPMDWAQTEATLGIAAYQLAQRNGDRDILRLARDAYVAALQVYQDMGPDYSDYFANKIDEIDGILQETP